MKFIKAKDQLPTDKKPVYCKNKEYRFILYHEDDCWRDWEDANIYLMDEDEHNEIEWLDESLPCKEEGLPSIIKKWVSDLESIEGEIIECKQLFENKNFGVGIAFANGNKYWLRLDKQAQVTLD